MVSFWDKRLFSSWQYKYRFSHWISHFDSLSALPTFSCLCSRCTDLINEYSCSCPAPTVQGDSYGGQNCTTYLSGCNAARQCGPGDCLPQLISETPLVHDFLCMCPPGYSGRRCELTTDFSFLHSATDGYFRNDMSAMDGEVSISLNFRTTLPNALLILCEVPLAKNEQPFVSVELVGGRVSIP